MVTFARMDKALRRRVRKLGIEELEQRVAPVILTSGGSYTFVDGNGDNITVRYGGPGQAEILGGGGGDPGTPGNPDIAVIDISHPHSNSTLTLVDNNPGTGADDIIGGAITTQGPGGAVNFGQMYFHPARGGVLRNTTITVTGDLGSLNVYGDTDTLTVACSHYMGALYVNGDLPNADITWGDGIGSFFVTGDVDPSHFDALGPVGSFMILGSYTDSSFTADGFVRMLYIGKNVDNSTFDCSDGVSMLYFGRNFINGSHLSCTTGPIGSVNIGGMMDNASYIELSEGRIPSVIIRGGMFNGSYIDILESVVGFIGVFGDVDDSYITLNDSRCNFTYIAGDLVERAGGVTTRMAVSDGALGFCYIGGGMLDGALLQCSNDSALGGALIGGDMTGNAEIRVDGPSGPVNLAGGMYDNAEIDIESGCTGLRVGGPIAGSGGERCTVDIEAQCGGVSIGGPVSDAEIWPDDTTSLYVGGTLTDSDVETAYCGSAFFAGGITDSEVDFYGGFGTLLVLGPVANTPVTAQCPCGTTTIMGGLLNGTSLTIEGGAAAITILGPLTDGDVTVNGVLSSFMVMGNLTGGSNVVVADNLGSAIIMGSMADLSSFVVNGNAGSLYIFGNVMTTHPAPFGVRIEGGCSTIMVTGVVGNTANITVLGNAPSAYFLGGLSNTGGVDIGGDVNVMLLGGIGMTNNSTVNIFGNTGLVIVSNLIDTNAWLNVAHGGLFSNCNMIIVSGLVAGRITVYGTLGSVFTAGSAIPAAQHTAPPPVMLGFDFLDPTGAPTGGWLDAVVVTGTIS